MVIVDLEALEWMNRLSVIKLLSYQAVIQKKVNDKEDIKRKLIVTSEEYAR